MKTVKGTTRNDFDTDLVNKLLMTDSLSKTDLFRILQEANQVIASLRSENERRQDILNMLLES